MKIEVIIMKSVYNVLKEPVSQYLRNDATRTFATTAFSQTVKERWRVEGTVSIPNR
jgi:hypothetical protein